MTLEERLRAYSDLQEPFQIEEESIQQTILASKNAWYQGEQESHLSGLDFLFQQAGFIRKRYWLFQAIVLLFLWWFLFMNGSTAYAQRSMGIMAPVFVILLFPELWKNQNNASMEIEAASCFSIRRIYAARMLLFAIVDILMLSLFFLTAAFTLKLTIGSVIVQFFLPMDVTCCICFGSLCSNKADSGYLAFIMSLIWIAVWTLIVMQESVYRLITAPVWGAMILLSIIYLIYSIHRVWKNCGRYWEVNLSWN